MEIKSHETWEEYCFRKTYYDKSTMNSLYNFKSLFESKYDVLENERKTYRNGGQYYGSVKYKCANYNIKSMQRIEKEIKEENEKKFLPTKIHRVIELIDLIKNEMNEPYVTELLTDYVQFHISNNEFNKNQLYNYNCMFKEETFTTQSSYLNEIAKKKIKMKKEEKDQNEKKINEKKQQEYELICRYEEKQIIINKQNRVNKQIEEFYLEKKKKKENELNTEIENLQKKLKVLLDE